MKTQLHLDISLNPALLDTARLQAEQQGVSLSMLMSTILTDYLSKAQMEKVLLPDKQQKLKGSSQKVIIKGVEIPDIVLNLLGTGEPVDEDDINGRKEVYTYLEAKHK
jgi:hypothetical protein